MKKGNNKNKSRKLHIGFTEEELKELDKYRKYLRSTKTKGTPKHITNFVNNAWFDLPYPSKEDIAINLEEFTKTGNAKYFIESFREQYHRLIDHTFIWTVLHLTRRKYFEAKDKGNKKLEKSIDKFFCEIGIALRGKYKKPSKIGILMSRLENYLREHEPGEDSFIYIMNIYERNKKNVMRSCSKKIKELELNNKDLYKQIKTKKGKLESIKKYGLTGSLKELKEMQEELKKGKKEIRSLEKIQKNTGHKEAKKRTLEYLEEKTKIKMEQRYFEDILALANKLFKAKPREGFVIPW